MDGAKSKLGPGQVLSQDSKEFIMKQHAKVFSALPAAEKTALQQRADQLNRRVAAERADEIQGLQESGGAEFVQLLENANHIQMY